VGKIMGQHKDSFTGKGGGGEDKQTKSDEKAVMNHLLLAD